MLDEGGDKCHNREGSHVRELPDMELSLRKVPCEVSNNSEVPVTEGSLSEVVQSTSPIYWDVAKGTTTIKVKG